MAQTKAAIPSARLDAALARGLLTQMQLIRRFEEKAAEMYAMGKIGGFLHLYIGQEAVAVGAMSTLRPDDYACRRTASTATAWPRARIPKRVMAELFGRVDGLSQGQGRLDAPLRQERQLPGRPRHRRRPPAAGGGRGVRHQVPGRRPGRALLLRRRRRARGRVPRVAEPRRALEAAGRLRLREQPLRHGHGHPPGARADGDLALRRDVRHPRRGRGRHGRAGRARVRGARRRAGAAGQVAGPDRGAHLSLPRPLDARPGRRGVPDQGGGRAREAARPDHALLASAA